MSVAVNKVSTEQVLNKAYRLAYFLHQDKSMAIRVVAAATLKLNVAMAVQSKRLYYVPVGRFSRGDSRRTGGIRNKALFSDLHLLQRLVYIESETYERQKERAAQAASPDVPAVGDPATEEDLLVYFIKHLVRITTKRNAFYVTLGFSRLLHSYSTLETMEIYNAVIGEPERVKDDYYYRSRKAVLMHEMYQRFGQLIRACRHQRGEERFETQPGTSELRSLVRECQQLFTPWDTQCQVPRDFDPLKSVIASLTSKSNADENEIEVNRIHAILDPDCFERLIAAFGYSPPAERMALPRFYLDQSSDESPPRQRNASSELSAEELAEINHLLDQQAGRRRRAPSTGMLRIMVDGIERGRLHPAEQPSLSFSADEDAEVIEVTTTDSHGDLLLATHLLRSFEKHTPAVYSIRLEGGQELSLSITRRQIEPGGGELLVTFGYQETNPNRAARLWWQRLNLRRGLEWSGASISILVAGVALICLTSYLVYVSLSSHQTTGPALTSVVQTTPLAPANEKINIPDKAAAKVSPSPRETKRSTAVKTPSLPSATAPAQDDADAVRSGRVIANLTLREVKKIYIEIRGDAVSSELRNNLVERLGSSGVVAATTDADEADAALKITVSQTSGGDVQASAVLVNARGGVLWRNTGRLSEIVKDLLSEIRLARNGQ